ncbi:hypothetical protein DL96DRAFT_1788013 [Flagelloscypha sp. PMI_526]|nr:hypothetical protein DL96DRAFT_1788013 [Flagelloscypha sp. PMI_526]
MVMIIAHLRHYHLDCHPTASTVVKPAPPALPTAKLSCFVATVLSSIKNDGVLDENLARGDFENVDEDGGFKITTQLYALVVIDRNSIRMSMEQVDIEGRVFWRKSCVGYGHDVDSISHVARYTSLSRGYPTGFIRERFIAESAHALECVSTQTKIMGTPLLLWLSLTNFLSSAHRDVISILMEAGVYLVVTFENGGASARFTYPLLVKTAITIGNPETMNTIADFSKFGWVADILVARKESTTDASQLSETLTATSHVAGLAVHPLGIEKSRSSVTTPELIK